jgi:hypothetical protein
MNKDPEKLIGKGRQAARLEERRKPRRSIAIVLVILTALSFLVYQVAENSKKPKRLAETDAVLTQDDSTRESDSAATQPSQSGARKANLAPKAASGPGRSPKVGSLAGAQELIVRLEQLDLSSGAIKPEEVHQLNDTFKQLIAQGAAGVPAIRAYLEKNQDLDFSNLRGGGLLDYKSLRMGLIDALKQVGGPEAMDVALETLKNTAVPWEVAVLARDLEQQAPGQFHQEALTAARESLAQGLAGGLGERDVAPLFQVLQSYGDASVVSDIEKALPQYGYYANITLANLPGGEGIPALIQEVQDPTAIAGGQPDIAMRMLAQVSANNPQASEALVALARANQVSAGEWTSVASGLAGYNLELGTPLVDKASAPLGRSGVQTIAVDNGAQNIFVTPVSASWLDGQINARLGLIDQLLAATTDPAGVQALQQARDSLTSKATELSMVPR